jgi:radical SAM protein with 4Fe4S-binding SPASM domain
LGAAGVRFGVNVVLTRQTFARAEATARRARALGAAEVQLLRFKPAGRGAGAVYARARLTAGQARGLYPLLARLAARPGLGVRIDCALVPFLSPHVRDASALERFGVFGCEAGRHLAAVRADGSAAPCSFVPRAPLVGASRLGRGALGGAEAARFRAHADAPPEPCRACPLRRVCRGGCRVVAAHAGDPSGPDPECPRVLAWRGAGGALG